MTTVVIASLWRDDAARSLRARAEHLLAKTNQQGHLRWVWVVGDSADQTESRLRDIAAQHSNQDIQVIRHDTGLQGEAPARRLQRLSLTVNAGLDQVRDTDDWWLHHESDLQSPPNLVDLFLSSRKEVIAGWVTLSLGNQVLFYDTWGYRKDGQLFTNYAPYHAAYRADQLFEVDSVGSVFMFPAGQVRRGLRCGERAVLDVCQQLRASGLSIWVDPRLPIVQPSDLWVSRCHA